jgi:putative transcriptional regulator
MDSLAGSLLIAIPDLHDINFFRTVVILFQHSAEGASGVILNRPSDVTVAKVWEEIAKEPSECTDFVNIGGPVEGPLIALHTNPVVAETPVLDGVFVSMGRDNLNQLVAQSEQQFKIFSGYSGWGPGQLESEIEQGGWLQLPANANHVFDSPEGLWKQVCDQVGHDILKPHIGKHLPGDPSLN